MDAEAEPDKAPPQVTAESESTLRYGSFLRTWTELSKINFLSSQLVDMIKSGQSIKRRSIEILPEEYSLQYFVPTALRNKEDLVEEQFPINVTSLMNEDQHWGCFYTFPQLYEDVYSPVVRIRSSEDVPPLVDGVLTRDMVTACLSYLKRTPILGDFVYIKLDLSAKGLVNIEVLQHYKYLVYLDLSSNLLRDLSVLSHVLYLQYLSVSYNRLSTVLEYSTPQWFLTEVHYKYNSVKSIRDLDMFWSITVLDLSHNNIKCISGLESLRYLRHLDLSFNHIRRIENLNHLRLLWLDLSYNNISCFEYGPNAGLWTLLHLDYLNINDNNLTSMKMFYGCTRLRELHARNNRLNLLLELAVYMRQLRQLIVLDLRGNPVCSVPSYKDVVFNTFPILLYLDSVELDPVELRSSKMSMTPDVCTFATRRLLRLLYVEQLEKARVSPYTPPADTIDVPIVVLVGYEAVGKGALARRLASECSSNIELAVQHTTATHHYQNHYNEVSRNKFDDMVLAGEFLTYSEKDGECYGLSRKEAFVKDAKVKIVTMDLIGALMLKKRGRCPYLILATCTDKVSLSNRQKDRKTARDNAYNKKKSVDETYDTSTLQVLLSGRIIITCILEEIISSFYDVEYNSRFEFDSDCSIATDKVVRTAAHTRGVNIHGIDTSISESSIGSQKRVHSKFSHMDESMYSLFKESLITDEYITSDLANDTSSLQEANVINKLSSHPQFSLKPKITAIKSFTQCKLLSSTWKAYPHCSAKSVTFVSQESSETRDESKQNLSGLIIEPQVEKEEYAAVEKSKIRSISTKLTWSIGPAQISPSGSVDDLDLWLTFLMDTGLLQSSETRLESLDVWCSRFDTTRVDDPNTIIRELEYYLKEPRETSSTNIREDYEDVHRNCPGLFWDTVTMENADKAFRKVKKIIREIVNSQKNMKPMFDIDFTRMKLPAVQKRLDSICNQIAPQRLFY